MTVNYSALAAKLQGTALVPGTEGYENALKHWAANVNRNAAVIAQVVSAEDVSDAIRFARANGLDIAVSGGRHSCFTSSSSEGGLLIDLSKMRSLSVDPEKRTVVAQGGCLAGDIYRATEPHDLVFAGSTAAAVGIGGLTLGGGFGYLTNQYGMTIDTLLSAQVVLASGDIVIANENENQDLFWAIRGGGGNFGVVTEFTFKLFHHPTPFWHGMILFKPEQVEDVVNAFNQYSHIPNAKSTTSIIMGCLPPTFDPAIAVIACYDGPEDQGRKVYKPFFDANPIADRTTIRTFLEMNTALDKMVMVPGRRYMTTTALNQISTPIVQSSMSSLLSLKKEFSPRTNGTIILLNDFPMQKSGPQNTDFCAFNRVPWYNYQIIADWGENPSLDSEMETWADKLLEKVIEIEVAGKSGDTLAGKWGYYNGGSGKTDASVVFGGKYRWLRELKRKFDPENVFNKWYPIEPAEEHPN